MTCKKCSKASVKDGLCKTHWIESKENIYTKNSDRDSLGVVKWAKEMLPEYTINDTPEIHKDMLMLMFELYDPIYKNRHQRLRNIISFRGSAKSTLLNMIFTLYVLCHNGQEVEILGIDGIVKTVKISEKFVVIASETGGSAEDFVVRLRDELSTNRMLKYFYGSDISDAQEEDSGQWTRRAFKYNKCFIMGAGVGQQIRGKIKGAYRITLLLVDDLYSENNIKTVDSRRNVRKWFYNAAINTVDDLMGKTVLVGTILHEDTVLVDNKKSKNWKTVEYPVMPLEKFNEFVKGHLKVNTLTSECELPFENEKDEAKRITSQTKYFQEVQDSKDWGLVWKDRINLYTLALKYQELVLKRETSSMFQEYFHQIISESEKKFRKEYFKYVDTVNVFSKYGFMWIEADDVIKNCNIEIGIDIGSGTEGGDDTSIAVVAATSDRRIYVVDNIVGKLNMRDITTENTLIIGFFDEIIRLVKRYNPTKVKVGYAGNEKGYISLLRSYLERESLHRTMVIGRLQHPSEGSKFERIMRTLLHLYESGLIYHKRGLDKLEYQLEYLTKAKNDDIADSLEVAISNIETPYEVDIKTFESIKKNKRPFAKALAYNDLSLSSWRIDFN